MCWKYKWKKLPINPIGSNIYPRQPNFTPSTVPTDEWHLWNTSQHTVSEQGFYSISRIINTTSIFFISFYFYRQFNFAY